jgi:hypothetical protein
VSCCCCSSSSRRSRVLPYEGSRAKKVMRPQHTDLCL